MSQNNGLKKLKVVLALFSVTYLLYGVSFLFFPGIAYAISGSPEPLNLSWIRWSGGFTKSYRPFIRVIGVVKKVPSAEVMWQSDVLVFGNKTYKGGAADADRIPQAELVSAFKVLTTQAIDLVVRSLNGAALQEMPVLDDTTASDLKF